MQTNPRASNVILGENPDSWDTTKTQLHDSEAGNSAAETRRSAVRTVIKERGNSMERKKTNLGHSMEFKSADQIQGPAYDTEGKNFKEFSPNQVKEARYTGIYLPGAADLKRIQNINRGRQRIGLPPLKKLTEQVRGV